MTHQPPSSRDDFDMAILCALPREFDAAVAVLDQVWDDDKSRALCKTRGDRNTYVIGRMWQHNVVLVLLPKRMGSVDAAIVAGDLRHSHQNLRLTLIVGICGGVPRNGDKEILLGDVVISSSLVQYDFGREYSHGFERKKGVKDNMAELNGEVAGIITMIEKSKVMAASLREKTVSCLKDLQEREPLYMLPDPATDRLFPPEYRHKHHAPHPKCADQICQSHVEEDDPVCKEAMNGACDELGCDVSCLVSRSRLENRVAAFDSPDADDALFNPEIHIGAVACANKVMKSGVKRDQVADQEGIIAFEMEGAGVWEHMTCLVIKGVCDYADSHKNKDWQDYAAGTAAAAAKALFSLLSPTDRKVPARAGPQKLGWIVPFPQDRDFVDQPEISAWLRERYQDKGARVALVGLGGIGKSQLAIQFAYGVRERSHVFWVNASTRDLLEQSYCAIAKRLKLGEGSQDSTDDTVRLVADWLADEENGQWTVVLDNFDDPSILREDDPQLRALLPQTSNGFTLITSRTLTGAELLTGDVKNTYSVQPMADEVAVELFQTKLSKRCEQEEAEEVVRLLNNMPLAISQTAAYINRCTPRMSAQEYAKTFQESDDKRTALLGSEYKDLRRYGSSASILSTWTVTFFEIRKEERSALDLLSLLSFFSPQSIPEWAVKAWYTLDARHLPRLKNSNTVSPSMSKLLASVSVGRRYLNRHLGADENFVEWDDWMRSPSAKTKELQAAKKKSRFPFLGRSSKNGGGDSSGRIDDYDPNETYSDEDDSTGADERYDRDIQLLLGYSLVTHTTRDRVLKMHPLVQYCTQEWMKRSGRMDTWKKRFLMIMARNIDDDRACERSPLGLMVHFNPILAEEPEDRPMAILWGQVVWFVANVWKEEGSLGAATDLVERMRETGDKILGPGDIFTLMSMDFAARLLSLKEKLDEAEVVCEDLLERAERANMSEVHAVQEARLEYARILLKNGRPEKAEQVISEVIERREETWGAQADDTLWCRGNLADVLAGMGRFEEATNMVLELLRVDWTDRDPSFHERTANCCAAVAVEISKHIPGEEVEGFLREIAEAAEANPKSCCPWFPYVASGPLYFSLSSCLGNQGKPAEAASALDRGMVHMAKLFPMPSDPSLQPPTLVEDLLEGEDDTEETRQRLLEDIIDNLRREEGTSRDFYWGIANVARRLYTKGRAGEAFKLGDALHRHLQEHAGLGETHLVTKRTWSFLDDLYWRHRMGHNRDTEEGAHVDSDIDEGVADMDLSD